MRSEDLFREGETSWTNTTGSAVELNPPGIIVQPGEVVTRDEVGNLRLESAPAEAPQVAKPEGSNLNAEGAGTETDTKGDWKRSKK